MSVAFEEPNDTINARLSSEKWPYIQTALRNVLWAEVEDGTLKIALLAKKKSKSQLALLQIVALLSDAEREGATVLTNAVMAAAYSGDFYSASLHSLAHAALGLPRNRRFKVFVCPQSGPVSSVEIG